MDDNILIITDLVRGVDIEPLQVCPAFSSFTFTDWDDSCVLEVRKCKILFMYNTFPTLKVLKSCEIILEFVFLRPFVLWV